MDVEIVESRAMTSTQLEDWQRLFESVPDARFYHHPHWYQCIAEHLSPAALNIGLLYQNNQLQMALPLCDSVGSRRRAHPEHDHLSLNDVLIHPELAIDTESLLNGIHKVLRKPSVSWWDWRVSNVPQQSALMQTLATANTALTEDDLQSASVQTVRNDSKYHWLLKQTRRSASFDCHGEACPPHGKLKRNLRRLRKQLQEVGEIRVENVTDPQQLLTAYEHFLTIEASGWKGTANLATAISANAELHAFYGSLLSPAGDGLNPEINLLWCNEQCVAAQFGLRTGSYLSLLKIGYNEEFARFSPGYLLLESILADCTNRGISTLSLVTSPPWAERWHPDTVPVWQINYYNNSTFGSALHQFDKLKQVAKSRLKQAA